MNIKNSEYEKKRNVFELCKWINKKLNKLEAFPESEKIYFERKGNNIKRLIEEAIPLASLGLYFYKPPSNVYINFHPENHQYDADLIVEGFNNFQLKVEVTTLENNDSALRRQALSRNGTVFTTGKIEKKGNIITSEPEMVDLNLENEKWINLALERCKTKINRCSDENTAILVSFNNFSNISLNYRAKLIQNTQKFLLKENPKVYGVYYSYRDFLVDGIKFSNRTMII